ncbi:unnamed protein product [Acanthoscelides obtectus]|uniref:Transposase n=1 Tax=Acanthoscelides obtectus TaxID=200917 RepID=A0A9P0M213_ACAOB|nr:unnamed protein product [Acanthoscelides obtectus]CAK1630035.1 Histone-lysine N-methyltransferase SETMAR [Acanthoscelides obtectus]
MELNREHFRAIIYYNFQRELLQTECLAELLSENVDAVRKLIIEDRHTSIQKNVHEELGVRKLVSQQKAARVNWCQKTLDRFNSGNSKNAIILHQDNASSHAAQKTRQYLTEENVELLDHPLYRPDLSPNNFFTFPKIKNRLRGQRFQSPEEAVDAFKNAVLDLPAIEWNKCFENWFERMEMCINLRGEYFEKQ